MFWGCISCKGVGTLKVVNGNMNSDKYIEVLDECLCSLVPQHFANRRWTIQEDNAPCHVSLRSNQWKQDNNVNALPWPAQSPDKNLESLETSGAETDKRNPKCR